MAGATERRGKARVNGTWSGKFRPAAHLPPSCHPKMTSIKLLPVYEYMYVKKKKKIEKHLTGENKYKFWSLVDLSQSLCTTKFTFYSRGGSAGAGNESNK